MRRRLLFVLPLFLLSAALMGQAPASSPPPFVVIVHPQNRAAFVTRAFLADAYLKRTSRWPDGERIRPVDLATGSNVRRRFSDAVLRRSVASVRSYWQRLIFSGRGVPPVELDEAEVAAYVARHRGAVAYVGGATPVGRAKVVEVR
jgi:ABC-type phosphate transport system substrate-binding protein